MTTTDLALVPPRTPIVTRLFGADPTLGAFGLLIALSLAVTLPALALDPRQFQGENVWIKPIKFQVALAIYFLSLAFFARWLPSGFLSRLPVRAFIAAAILATVGEFVWIGGAAMFQTASHFNVTTPVMEAIYGLMGLFAVTLTTVSLVYGIAIWRNQGTGLPSALHLSIALGLVLTFGLTVLAAGVMASAPGHHVGTPVTGATVPLMGWSREVGDLRIAHFFATHAMHGLPLVGLAAARMARGRAVVWAAAGAYAAITTALLVQALIGLPLIPT